MAKTPKVKKREVSMKSRAARRGATSPPPKDLPVKSSTATEETEYKPWLHNAQNAGIHKKQKKGRTLTRQQKVRQQRGLEHAERNIDRHEKKVADSKKRGRKVQARAAEWDELNEKILGEDGKEVMREHGEEGAKPAEVGEGEEGTKEGVKQMEGVEMLDGEQALPLRLAETDIKVAKPLDEVALKKARSNADAISTAVDLDDIT